MEFKRTFTQSKLVPKKTFLEKGIISKPKSLDSDSKRELTDEIWSPSSLSTEVLKHFDSLIYFYPDSTIEHEK
jgi:hypothetical protein